MVEERGGREAALSELRQRLEDGLARSGLTKTQLAERPPRLGRTTVQQAFQANGPVPSPTTVAVLARKLGLPVDELLALRRAAEDEVSPVAAAEMVPGRPIGNWDPYDLEVHPAGSVSGLVDSGTRSMRAMPGYVSRAHDRVLREAVREAAEGRSRMLVLVGRSSTGKTRACWEAVQPLTAEGWRLWHPFDPTRAEAALADLGLVAPGTVVWLNEAQHYLGHPHAGERIAAALHTLLTHPDRRPVLVLGTLWPEYADAYAALPDPGRPDPHSRVRELLTGRMVPVPDTFDKEALRAAAVLAEGGDQFMADTLTRARAHGRVTQDLAGAPELLRRYEHGSAAARALIEVAMDARRFGVGLQLPQGFLTAAVTDYFADHDWDELADGWTEAAFAELARPVHGKQAPLRRTGTRPAGRAPGPGASAEEADPAAYTVLRLADFLEQHGRTIRRGLCPPASFWRAADTHLTDPDDLISLASAAEARHRLKWAHHLRSRAAGAGHPDALERLAHERANTGDLDGAEALARRAADAGEFDPLVRVAVLRERAGDRELAEALARRAAEAGNHRGWVALALARHEAGNREGFKALIERAADYPGTLLERAWALEQAGELEGAEALFWQAADAGNVWGLVNLASAREHAGDRAGAEALARQAADAGEPAGFANLARSRRAAGNLESAEFLALQAAAAGFRVTLAEVAKGWQSTGDLDRAEELYWQAVDFGDTGALIGLTTMFEEAGRQEHAERLALLAAREGYPEALTSLVLKREAADPAGAAVLAEAAADSGHMVPLALRAAEREKAGNWEGAEDLYRQAAEADPGSTTLLPSLARLRQMAGDQRGAEDLYRQAAEADPGNGRILLELARLRQMAGDQKSVEELCWQAVDVGYVSQSLCDAWPYGFEPDGSPYPPWRSE
ncbi:hypothetical protein ACIA8O_30495 [Kitasatospora sp. NPDC051853]|uniref:hypothetical protein n=1 Tax=Kitasatospora sp. NPDC051853 TaxID=3364058 RepID=UPI0037B340F1